MTDGNRTIIETPRLLLREMTPADRPDLCMILQDKEVMCAYNGPFSDEEVNGWLERQTGRYREWGYGLWAVVLKQTGKMIGQCGVTRQLWNGEEMLEVGYLFRHSHWHQGYATEAARACMEYAFNVLGASEVCSIIRDNNIPSQRVALRNGMRKAEGVMVKHYRGAEMPHWLYLTTREEFSGIDGGTDGSGSGKNRRILTVHYQAPCGEMLLGSLGDRLCLCDWTHELHPGRVANRLRRILKAESEDCGQISGDTPGQSAFPEILLRTVRELDEYFRGERKEFDLPLLLAGSEFQKRVWQQLRLIPYGQTVSYGELAAAIGAPKSVRAVANANGANAISIILPCHRVIGSDGSLTGYGGGTDTKRYLLELEKKY
ncbi:putative uncharacterized protein [Alistipes sp. CAG:831]|nr:putative uncharacterized protein [Alistipes sp. CAG:831]